MVEALRAGVCDFLELPVDRAALRTSIEHAIRHSQSNASNAGDLGPRHSRLTPREREVMRLLSEGKQTKQIAMELSISPKTVEKHRSKVLHKMEAHTVVDLVRMLLRPPTNGC